MSNKKDKSQDNRKIIARNKKALRDFFILERYEAGILLKGNEIKSIREGRANLKDSYGRVKNRELFLYNMHISPYSKSRIEEVNPTRIRKLLMQRKEIDRIEGKLSPGSLTLVPLSLYLNDCWAKVELGLVKSKTKGDKRRYIRDKEHKKEINRALKNFKR